MFDPETEIQVIDRTGPYTVLIYMDREEFVRKMGKGGNNMPTKKTKTAKKTKAVAQGAKASKKQSVKKTSKKK